MDELEALIVQNQKQNEEANTLLESSVLLQKQIADSLNGVAKIVGEKGDKGDKGEDGYSPIKGQDYFTQDEINEIKEEIRPIKGQDYFTGEEIEAIKQEITPIKGKDYFDGKNGKDADEDKIVNAVIAKLPKQTLIEKKFGEKIDKVKKEIESKLPEFKSSAQSIPVKVNGVEVAGKLESINIIGTGLAVSADKWGNISISASMPIPIDLSDQCDGVNKIFTLPSFSSVLMLSNGSSFPGLYRPFVDFNVLSSTQIELTSEVSAPEAGQTLIALVI